MDHSTIYFELVFMLLAWPRTINGP